MKSDLRDVYISHNRDYVKCVNCELLLLRYVRMFLSLCIAIYSVLCFGDDGMVMCSATTHFEPDAPRYESIIPAYLLCHINFEVINGSL